jgi:hypothetical protein
MAGDGDSGTVGLTRWMATIGALALYFVGSRVPLPGVDVRELGGEAPPLLSLFGLGATPIVSGLVVMEIARLAFPPLARWAAKGARQAQLYLRIARGLALGFAALQAVGIATGFEAAHVAAGGGGWPFRLENVVALVGATAFLIWLAGAINANGVGDGLVLLFAAPVAARFPIEVARWSHFVRMGVVTAHLPALLLALTVLSVAALVAVSRRGSTSGPLDLWSPLIAWKMTGFVGALIALLQVRVVALIEEAGVDVGPAWASPRGIGAGVLNVLIFAGLIAVAALRRAHVDKLDRTAMFWPQLAVEIVVCCAGRLLLFTPGGVSDAIGLGVILCVAAALSVLRGWRGGRALAPG